LKFYVVA